MRPCFRRVVPGLRTAAMTLITFTIACGPSPAHEETRIRTETERAAAIDGRSYQVFQAELCTGAGSSQTSPAPTHRYLSQNGTITVLSAFTPGGYTYSIRVRAQGQPSVGAQPGIWPRLFVVAGGVRA